jgi:heat shock protein HslJ
MHTRTLIAGLAVVAFGLAACSGGTGGTGGTLDGQTWALTSYAKDGAMTNVPADVLVDATFDGGTVSGSAGCNRYTGPYTVDGAKLTFGNLATTMMACVGPAGDVESAYLANLAASATYTATAETLTIFDAKGASILVYGIAKPGQLGGVEWHATAINNGRGGVESVVQGTDPTATYDPAGTVSGNAGCNTFNGPAVVDGTSIAIGPLASTKMACADEKASAQETAYLAALEAATTFEVRGAVLELRDADGALQVMFKAP